MSGSGLLKSCQRPGCCRPCAEGEDRCPYHLGMVWRVPLPIPLVLWVRPFSRVVALGDLHRAGWLQITTVGVRTSTEVGGYSSAARSLTAHGSGIITLPQILLNLEEHFAGAGMGLAQARIITHGLLNGVLSSPRAQPGCTGHRYEQACQGHVYMWDAVMVHTYPPPAVFKIKIMPYSSLWCDQPHLCSALPGLSQRSRGSLLAERRHMPSPAPK